ncbi:MAG TPA: FtsX-like permease family protein [Steroidobacteraceae bacterium]|jgi:putative ABC transport system permease protein|nr:FtsX-like permease family protein [Steroidobacteraceae bacterium]
MNIPFRPILSALLRNRTGALLVAIQISIALAVLVNAVYIVKQRVDKMNRPTGIDDQNIFVVSSTGFARDFDYNASLREDLDYLRGIPGVISAVAVNAVPLSGGGSSNGIGKVPHQPARSEDGNYFTIDEHGLETLGLRLIAGRNFRPDEILPPPNSVQNYVAPQVILTKSLADALFPQGDALGKTIYDVDDHPSTIIGIADRMMGSWVWYDQPDYVFFMPYLPTGPSVRYLVRTQPGQRDAIMRVAETHLSASNPRRAINWVRSLELFKKNSYLADRNMGVFLTTVTTLLLAITSLGIFGLATFNVSTRTKQIGTRRAVGARRRDIVSYFLVENWLITTGGIVVGCMLALAVGYWLASEYHLPRVDLFYLVGGVLILWGIGTLAAWQPARRAAKVSPALATRTA